jgi:hypothetical protein
LDAADTREIHERPVIGDPPITKQSREQGQRVIGQRWINERFLPVEGFRRATAWQAISVQFALDNFGEKL